VEIAAVGVSIAIFNQVSKVCIYPLVSVTTSFVAEEDAIISGVIEGNRSPGLEKAWHLDSEPNNLPVSGIQFLEQIWFEFFSRKSIHLKADGVSVCA
jgi:hypothetical protein